jgi:transcriptional regulator with GAF, ATPase, and Fis domain/tRNA A37 threonylcarbamoyladenosine biosynthesis protein TsaE
MAGSSTSFAESSATLLAGRYRFVRELGRGATGRVLLAEDVLSGDAPRALKVVGARHAALLALEAERLASVVHPALARFHELLRVDRALGPPLSLPAGSAVLVEEHVEGRRADAVAEGLGSAAARAALAVQVGHAVARALGALHAAGIVHGDVKPANVLVSARRAGRRAAAHEPPRVRLVDLGLACAPGVLGALSGTPAFLAPEAWLGERGARTDLYALGVTLRALLAPGEHGEHGVQDVASAGAAVRAALADDRAASAHEGSGAWLGWRPPGPLPAGVPAPLASLVDALVDPEPSRRPGSAREVAARLALVAERLGTPLRDASAEEALAARGAPAERAAAVEALPLAGRAGDVEALAAAIGAALDATVDAGAPARVVVARGPAGSGRSRLVREAVRRLQLRRAAGSHVPPTYIRAAPGEFLARAPLPDAVLHLDTGRAAADAALELAQAAALVGARVAVVVEADEVPATLEASPCVALGPLDDRALSELLGAALGARPSAALVAEARAVSGGLPGVLCRALAAALAAGADPSRAGALRAAAAEVAHARPAGEAGDPELAAPRAPGEALARDLAVAGGALPITFAPGPGGRGAEVRALLARGEASIDGHGILRLREDRAAAILTALDGRERARRARALLEADASSASGGEAEARRGGALDDVQRALLEVWTADTVCLDAAFATLAAALAARSAAGDVLGALALARAALLAADEGTSAGRGPAAAGATRARPGDGEAALRVVVGDALRALGRYDAATAALDGVPGAAARRVRAECARLAGRPDDAARELEGIAAPAGVADPAACALRARVALDLGELDAARSSAELAEAGGDVAAAARGAEVEALVLLRRGDVEGAAVAAERAVRRASGAPARVEARALGTLAYVARARGDVRASAALSRRAAELAEQAGEHHAAATFLANVGSTRLDLGELGPALEALEDAAARLARLGRPAEAAASAANLASAAELVGDDERALGIAARVRATLAAAPRDSAAAVAAIGAAAIVEADVALRRGRVVDAASALDALLGASDGASALDAPGGEGRDDGPRDGLAGPPSAGGTPAGAHARHPGLPPALEATVAARRALVAAAAGDAAVARAAARRAAACAEDAPAARLEATLAEVAAARAEGRPRDAWAAASAALRAAAGLPFEARLRAALAAASAAREAGEHGAANDALGAARALLDGAARTLAPGDRARLRAVAAYREALGARPTDSSGMAGSAGRAPATAPGGVGTDPMGDDAALARWRRLARWTRRLAVARSQARLDDTLLEAALDLVGAERAAVVARAADGGLAVRARRALGDVAPQAGALDVSRSVVERVLAQGSPVAAVDAATDLRLAAAESVHALALRSVLAVPLPAASGDAPPAALYVEDRVRPAAFDAGDTALLVELAAHAGTVAELLATLRRERRAAARAERLRSRLDRLVQRQGVELSMLRPAEAGAASFGLVGTSTAVRELLALVRRVARADVPVLVLGESGTGKELVARAIHAASRRASARFVAENCGAIPEPLLESELFGHVRGAFTGADRPRVGLFETADGGTLLLDEIGEMGPSMQARLLRVLQEGEVRPVGADRSRKVDVRVVAATHRDLEQRVREGAFREDLFYRLAVVTVRVPPLRERPEDVPLLVAHFVAKHGEGRSLRVERAALDALCACPWPGNVRQLENELRRALVLAEDVIRLDHLSPAIRGAESAGAAGVASAASDAAGGARAAGGTLRAQVDALERRLVRAALAEHRSQAAAARALGVSRFGLQKMMRRLGVQAP